MSEKMFSVKDITKISDSGFLERIEVTAEFIIQEDKMILDELAKY